MFHKGSIFSPEYLNTGWGDISLSVMSVYKNNNIAEGVTIYQNRQVLILPTDIHVGPTENWLS